MSMKLGNTHYQGPFNCASALANRPGVYAILRRNRWTYRWEVIDIGASDRSGDAVRNHQRLDHWQQHGQTLGFCIYYCSRDKHSQAIEELMRWYDPPLYEDSIMTTTESWPGVGASGNGW